MINLSPIPDDTAQKTENKGNLLRSDPRKGTNITLNNIDTDIDTYPQD